MINLNYPLLLVHGVGSRDDARRGYWGRIPKALEKEGCTVFFGNQDANAAIETNGAFLAERIKEILAQTGAKKLNVIAHSKGGIDARYAISSLNMGECVASLTTICTPHHGSVTMDKIMRLPNGILKAIFGVADRWFRSRGDARPENFRVFLSMTTNEMERFNRENPDDPDVYYQSYAVLFKTPFSDMSGWIRHLVVKCIEGENDGLLTPKAVRWTNFRGIYTGATNRGISHFDAVDARRKPFCKKPAPAASKMNELSDIVDFYLDLVRELAEMGF